MGVLSHVNTIIIGAGAAGLASAVCLKKSGIEHMIFDENAAVGKVWRSRYDRLHLHTTRSNSSLPYFPMPRSYPKYISKDDFATYLEEYARAFDIKPRFNQKVKTISRTASLWQIATDSGTFTSDHVVIATGQSRLPRLCTWRGIETFNGKLLHSANYTAGKAFTNKKVLVIGFGNSACEIAICLYENGAYPSLSVRSCVNILPRDLFGIPIVDIAIMQSWLTNISPQLADMVNKPVLQVINGNISKVGLSSCKHGPMTQIFKEKKVPLLDIGTMALIRKGKIKVYPGIEEMQGRRVKFTDGREENFDTVISATGFTTGLGDLLPQWQDVCDSAQRPLVSGKESALAGLYFCGFNVSPAGMLREIGIEAKKIADSLERCMKSSRPEFQAVDTIREQ